MVIARNSAPRNGPCVTMFGSPDILILPALTFVAVFALVGLIWNVAEGLFEEQRKDQR